ncbi:MAG: BlaI/MecI/CopY family transcriptional regulator, partial [Deltaproteobacteria bacterium]|nr:BlaI/MecI/CopY family transcriptional regulator [Deltaproteobacteria bacterium]
YQPLLSKASYETKSLNHMVSQLFEGEPSSLVLRLLDNSDLSQDELKSIRKILNERMRS